jgi:hypothetical protein
MSFAKDAEWSDDSDDDLQMKEIAQKAKQDVLNKKDREDEETK